MIVEFVHTFQLSNKLKTLIQKDIDEKTVSEFKQTMTQLIHHNSQWTKGTLGKLKEYCELFSRNSSFQDKNHIDLHMSSHFALSDALHIQEILNHSIPLNDPSFQKVFKSFTNRVNKIIRHFPLVMKPFEKNENVILCLLRTQQTLIEANGSDFIDKRFKWPEKTPKMVEFLTNCYEKRGFEALLPTIRQMGDK